MDPYLAKLVAPTPPKEQTQAVDPRSLPLYICNRKGKRLILIKQKLDAAQMGLLKTNMYLLSVEQQMGAEDYAKMRREVDAVITAHRRDGTS
jgi:hypothetical protein